MRTSGYREMGTVTEEEARAFEFRRQTVWRKLRRGQIDDPMEGLRMIVWPSRELEEASLRAVREGPLRHGTHTQYLHGCRCEICREAHLEHNWKGRGIGKTNGSSRP